MHINPGPGNDTAVTAGSSNVCLWSFVRLIHALQYCKMRIEDSLITDKQLSHYFQSRIFGIDQGIFNVQPH